MSTNLPDILDAKLPAHLQNKTVEGNAFANAMFGGGFPTVSIKGRAFNIIRGGERELITNSEGDAAGSILAVILATNPNKSKIYYKQAYAEGSDDRPDCYSNDSMVPSPFAPEPQSKNCQACSHSVWGSKITDAGAKSRACGDSMRICIAPADQLNDPLLLRIPPATLKPLGQYGELLAKRGVAPHMVVTKIAFERDVAHPQLTFTPSNFVSAEQLAEIEQVLVAEKDIIGRIIGTVEDAPMVNVERGDPTPPPPPPPVTTAERPPSAEAPTPLAATPPPGTHAGFVTTEPLPEPVQSELFVTKTPEPLPAGVNVSQPPADTREPAAVGDADSVEDINKALDDLNFDD